MSSYLKDKAENVHIKMEQDGDVEMGQLPVCREFSIRLTDCRKWLQGRDYLFLGENIYLMYRHNAVETFLLVECLCCTCFFYPDCDPEFVSS